MFPVNSFCSFEIRRGAKLTLPPELNMVNKGSLETSSKLLRYAIRLILFNFDIYNFACADISNVSL